MTVLLRGSRSRCVSYASNTKTYDYNTNLYDNNTTKGDFRYYSKTTAYCSNTKPVIL